MQPDFPNDNTMLVLKFLIVFYFVGRLNTVYRYVRYAFKNEENYRQHRRVWLIAIGLGMAIQSASIPLILGYGHYCVVPIILCTPMLMPFYMLTATMALANKQYASSQGIECVFIFFTFLSVVFALWILSEIHVPATSIYSYILFPFSHFNVLTILLPLVITLVFYKAPIAPHAKAYLVTATNYFAYYFSFLLDLLFIVNATVIFVLH